MLDPGLPYGTGLWAVGHRGGTREESVWPERRRDLAPYLGEGWATLAEPFRLIRGLSSRFWTNNPDKALDPEERAALERLHDAICAAKPS